MAQRKIERGYPEIQRTDSSKGLRNDIRAFWGSGEQLWDADFNNNFQFINWWLNPEVSLRRQPYPPFNFDGVYTLIPPNGPLANSISVNGAAEAIWQVPFTGSMAYVREDRMYVTYSGAAWVPVLYVPLWRPIVEIAVFGSAPKTSSIMASHLVQEPFTIPAEAPGSRARNFSRRISLSVTKNGLEVGTIGMNSNGFGLFSFAADVSFAVGDVLAIETPDKLWGSRAISVSILGKVT